MLSFLLSPLGKYAFYAVGIILIIGAVFGWYEIKIAEAKREALASFNQKQLEEVVKEQNIIISQMSALKAQEEAITEQTNKLNDNIKNKISHAEIVIKNSKDHSLDPIFNQILKSLRGE